MRRVEQLEERNRARQEFWFRAYMWVMWGVVCSLVTAYVVLVATGQLHHH
jgi:hypothetical protein